MATTGKHFAPRGVSLCRTGGHSLSAHSDKTAIVPCSTPHQVGASLIVRWGKISAIGWRVAGRPGRPGRRPCRVHARDRYEWERCTTVQPSYAGLITGPAPPASVPPRRRTAPTRAKRRREGNHRTLDRRNLWLAQPHHLRTSLLMDAYDALDRTANTTRPRLRA